MKIGDVVSPVVDGIGDNSLPPGVRANGMRMAAMRGVVEELWSPEESAERLGAGYREPHAWVRWHGKSSAAWPVAMLRKAR